LSRTENSLKKMILAIAADHKSNIIKLLARSLTILWLIRI